MKVFVALILAFVIYDNINGASIDKKPYESTKIGGNVLGDRVMVDPFAGTNRNDGKDGKDGKDAKGTPNPKDAKGVPTPAPNVNDGMGKKKWNVGKCDDGKGKDGWDDGKGKDGKYYPWKHGNDGWDGKYYPWKHGKDGCK